MKKFSSRKIIGYDIHRLAKKLWPLNRSITGEGVRKTLSIISKEIPNLKIYSVPSNTKAFDWIVPKEWIVKKAYIVTPEGKKNVIFKK